MLTSSLHSSIKINEKFPQKIQTSNKKIKEFEQNQSKIATLMGQNITGD